MSTENCLLQRVRQAVQGQALIDWSLGEFEPFLALFDVVRLEAGELSAMKHGSIYLNRLPDMIRMHAQRRTTHVLFTHLDENWGAFSTTVPGRTVDWGDWNCQLQLAGCTPEMVRSYLDDPAVKAVVTTQHTAFWHPKVLTIPIGIKPSQALIDQLIRADGIKTQDLLLNNSGWGHRRHINECVIANFGARLKNRYGQSEAEYFESISRARFVLCPSGLGWDSYRIWETLLLGSIPVVEHSEGWHTVLQDLPVLTVAHFDQLTPQLLAREYPRILSACASYDFGKLGQTWWVAKIRAALQAA